MISSQPIGKSDYRYVGAYNLDLFSQIKIGDNLMNKKLKFLSAGFISICISIANAMPVAALESNRESIERVLSRVSERSLSPETAVFSQVADLRAGGSVENIFDATVSGVEVEIPSNGRKPIKISPSKDEAISISLPFPEDESNAFQVLPGVAAFEHKNSSTSVVIVKNDGSLQVTTKIDSQTAPEVYEYKVELPIGSKVQSLGEGLIILRGQKIIGMLAAPWAEDASGQDVRTKFKVTKNSIIQVVHHREKNYSYPIVADPWLGFNLFDSVVVSSVLTKNQPVVNLNLSVWGWSVYTGVTAGGVVAGQEILNSAGWSEAWAKGGAVRAALDKPSQRQQFACHALGAFAAGEWNLEKYRPNRTNGDWLSGVASHHCNWKYSYGGESE